MERLRPEAEKFLRGPNFAHLATISSDGIPHVSPIWIDIEDGRPVLNTAVGRVKERHLRRDPRLTLSIQDITNPYTYAEITGVADELTLDGADEHINALAKKYLGLDEYPGRAPGEQRIKVYVTPLKVRGILVDED